MKFRAVGLISSCGIIACPTPLAPKYPRRQIHFRRRGICWLLACPSGGRRRWHRVVPLSLIAPGDHVIFKCVVKVCEIAAVIDGYRGQVAGGNNISAGRHRGRGVCYRVYGDRYRSAVADTSASP